MDKVNVEGDRFMSDPEKLYHYCIEANMTQTYMEVMVKQIQRFVLLHKISEIINMLKVRLNFGRGRVS